MTKYDPFSFGAVNLAGKPDAAGAPAPDDMLFADAGPVKQAPPATDTSWDSLDANVDTLLPGASAASTDAVEFGADILGEVGPGPARTAPAAKAPRPAAKPAAPAARKSGGASMPTKAAMPAAAAARAPGVSIQATEAAARAAVAKPAAPVVRRGAPALPTRSGSGLASLLVPLAVLGVGGIAASWFYMMQQNPVMAGITALLSVVGAAFAWLSLRG